MRIAIVVGMTPLRRLIAIISAVCTAMASLGLLFVAAQPASAIASSGHGVGHLSSQNGFSWLGSYRLDDGSLVFCLEAGKQAPTGHDYAFVDASTLGRFSPDDLARLAYISRSWAGSADATEAASGQLATWAIAGLQGHSLADYASRANESAQAVLDATDRILAITNGPLGASRSVTADVELTPVTGSGSLSVSTNLTVDFLSSGPTRLATGSASGLLTLTGATFDDSTSQRIVTNGESYPITATGPDSVVDVAASVTYDSLPYGSQFTAGLAGDTVQQVLVGRPGSAKGSDATTVTVPSSKRFQPAVTTKTSASVASVGATISDELVLSARPDSAADTLLSEWGVYLPATPPPAGSLPAVDAKGMLPIPVVVESSLLGPFPDPIEPAADAPMGAPVVCTVEVDVATGPGTYRTPECTLPSSGYYVWVERIVPERTPEEKGGGRILPWQSTFGTASEITFVEFPPPVVPEVPDAAIAAAPPVLADTGLGDGGAALLPLSLASVVAGLSLLVGVLWARRASHRAPGRRGESSWQPYQHLPGRPALAESVTSQQSQF